MAAISSSLVSRSVRRSRATSTRSVLGEQYVVGIVENQSERFSDAGVIVDDEDRAPL
jgi:hypothetical protein